MVDAPVAYPPYGFLPVSQCRRVDKPQAHLPIDRPTQGAKEFLLHQDKEVIP